MFAKPNPSKEIVASNIRNSMIAISGISRANGGLIKQITGSLTAEGQKVYKQVETQSLFAGQATYDVEIDPCETMTIAVSCENFGDEVSLALKTPAGDIITPDSPPDVVEVIFSPNHPYLGLRVKLPDPGGWQINVIPIKQAGSIINFQIFVFGENTHISGGVIAAKRFYDPGDVILLEFRGCYDLPFTNAEVIGRVRRPDGSEGLPIEFRDDEKKDPRAGRPGNGLYSGILSDTLMPGIYTITVTVDNSRGRATYTEPGENFPQIPAFRRDYTITLAIGEQPVSRVEIEPNNGSPGGKLQVNVKGNLTHFRRGSTSFDFGEGITVSEVQIKDDLTALVTLSIGSAAVLGPRTVRATTDDETVETDEGFQVVPHERVWSDKWIIRLLILIIILLLILLLMLTMSLRRGI